MINIRRWILPAEAAKATSFLGKKVIYINAQIIDPLTNLTLKGSLITANGKILDFGANLLTNVGAELSAFEEIIDCQNNLLIPGIIDLHVHLREPGQLHKETIHTGTKAAAAGGVTTVVCQPNTIPNINNIETLLYIQEKAKETAYVNVKAYANITKNGEVLTDILGLYKAGAVGFTDDGLPVMNPQLMREALKIASATKIKAPIAQHAEDLFLSNKGCINEGHISEKLNVPGISDLSEAVMVTRDIMLLDQCQNAHYHVLHISTESAVKAVEKAKKQGLNVTAEVTPHHLLLNENIVESYNTLAKMNPPLRSEKNRLAMVEALKNNIIEAIASDHAPHEAQSKELPLTEAAFGIIGVETMLPLSLELYHNGAMSLHALLAKLTCGPANIINSKAGRIAIGAPADLVILDLNKEWIIDIDKLSSKSKNSPFHGRKVKGKVLRTVVAGYSVFIDC